MYIKLCIVIFGIFILLPLSNVYSNPTGKSLSCNSIYKENSNYKNYKGISFETEKSVRVVTLKMKNNQLKVVSKLTPYKVKDNNILFKIKFIWYGNIFFEEFNLNRESLDLMNTSKNKVDKLKCDIVEGDFMHFMNKKKDIYQEIFEKKLRQGTSKI
tara:strand:- start:946 stop:1416 length:471 start_codon:yes stop_codon:yes gene_type:complete